MHANVALWLHDMKDGTDEMIELALELNREVPTFFSLLNKTGFNAPISSQSVSPLSYWPLQKESWMEWDGMVV